MKCYTFFMLTLNLPFKKNECRSNPETKIGEDIPCIYSMSTIWALNYIKNKHGLYRGKDCMKEVCESSEQHAKNIIDIERKKMLLLRKEESKLHQDTKAYYICGNRILKEFSKIINYWKVRYHCHYTGK